MEFPHFVVHRGDARAYRFSITRIAGFGGVGSLASRGPRAVAAVGVPRCAGLGARPAVHARAAVFVGGAAGDRDPGDRGGHARLRRVRDLGAHRPRGGACRARGAIPVRPSEKTFRSVLSCLDAADLDRRLGAYFTALAAEQAAAAGGSLAVALDGKTATRCTPRRSRGRASGVGVRPPRPAGPRAARCRRQEQRNPLRAQASPLASPHVRLLVTVDAMHTQRATATLICGTLKSHYLMIVKSNQTKLLARIDRPAVGRGPGRPHRPTTRGHGRVETRTLKILTAARGIGFPYARQVVQITRERIVIATGARTVEVVYAICSLPFEQARPADDHRLAARALGNREQRPLGARRDVRRGPLAPSAPAPVHRSWPRSATPSSTCTASWSHQHRRSLPQSPPSP